MRLASPEQVRAESSRRWFADWCRRVDGAYQVAPHHRRLIDRLEAVERGECRRLIVSMPPRHGKSLTSTVRFPAWFLGRNPHKRVIIATHTASLAADFSRRARNEFVTHGADVFGVEVADDSSAVDHWQILGHPGGLVAAGVGGPITGRGADCLIIDDPMKDAAAADSAVQRKTITDWYQQVARTRLHPGGSIVLVMTRWHEKDLAGFLLAEAESGGEQWEQLVLPMVADDGSHLWPGRYTEEEIAGLRRAVGSRAWEALYQQRPSPAEGSIFKNHWWRFWRRPSEPDVPGLEARTVVVPERFDQVVASWDCTFKGTSDADKVAGGVWGRLGADRYLLDLAWNRMDIVATIAALQSQVARMRPHAVLVEDKANGPAVVSMLRDKVPGLIAVNPQGGKEARANAVAPAVEAGNVLLPLHAAWRDDYIAEHAAFPRGAHDDAVDQQSQALGWMREGEAEHIKREPTRSAPRGLRASQM